MAEDLVGRIDDHLAKGASSSFADSWFYDAFVQCHQNHFDGADTAWQSYDVCVEDLTASIRAYRETL